jgi:hypothetical protein
MISSDFNFEEFSKRVKYRDCLELIYLADREATETERLIYRKGRDGADAAEERLIQYAQTLKALIWFVRYGIKPKAIKGTNGQIFDALCREVAENRRFQPRCLDEVYRSAATPKKAPARSCDEPRP